MKFRVLASFLFIIAVLFSLSDCSNAEQTNRIEYAEFGMILADDFEPYDSDGAFDVAYANVSVMMGMKRYSFVNSEEYGLLSTLTPEKLAEVYREKSGMGNSAEILSTGDVPYYYYSTADGYVYLIGFYRTPYAYFVITYITPTVNFESNYDDIIKYLESAYILKEHI